MPVYQDEKTKRYYFSCYYVNWQGERKRKVKRGFALAREAKEAEREFLSQYNARADMTFQRLAEIYLEDCKARLKEITLQNKTRDINNVILPFFAKHKITDITPAIVRQWQNGIIEKYAPTTQHQYQGQLSAIFNFAMKFYGLQQNPAKIAGTIGSLKSERARYWTVATFNKVMEQVTDQQARTAFIVLFYSGLRIGELLALTMADYDRAAAMLDINKTASRIKGVGYIITPPKTKKAIRKVVIPRRAAAVLDEYINTLYEPQPKQRIFFRNGLYFLRQLQQAAETANAPKIRLHDLRHSHASLLINNNVSIKAVSERLGHEDVTTTLNIYSHLYAQQDNNIAEMLDKL